MTSNYSFINTFAEKVGNPDLFDAAGAVAQGADQFFVELGKIAKKAKEGTLTAADIPTTKALLQKFADGVNRLNGRVAAAGASSGNPSDGKFARMFQTLASRGQVSNLYPISLIH